MELVKKSNLQVIANTLATILVSAGLTPSDIKETLRLTENLTEEIPYGIKDICEEMNLTSDNIHCVIDECLNHKLSTEYTGTVWINLSNGHFVKERSGVFGC